MTPPPNDQQSATIAPPASAPGGSRDSEQEKLKMIRELLVGDQLQVLNNRFHQLEKGHESHYARIGNELMTKFEALKVLNESELDDLGKSVAAMVAQLQKEDTAIREEIKSGTSRLADLENLVSDTKAALTEQVRKMHDEFSRQMSEFSRLIRSQQDDVARQAVSRTDFAKILKGLAGSLAAEESEPKNQD
jgi:F0F1-type ATP synthase membrane subunit b/b'